MPAVQLARSTIVHYSHSPPACKPFVIPCAHGQRLVYRGRPLVMGILNVTPDSFSDGGRHLDPAAAVERGLRMVAEGADLIDIGGESTRPGAAPVDAEEELRRILPVVLQLAKRVRVPLSVDTSKASVALRTLEVGASMINDVTGMRGDAAIPRVAKATGAALVLMHMRGTPRTMQRSPRYHNVVREVAHVLLGAIRQLQDTGIQRSRILIDPGLGFGKLLKHNLQLLHSLPELTALGYPVVIGPSRKSFIGQLLGVDIHERLAGTLACLAHAARSGVHIVRVHDVRPAVQLLQMIHAIEHVPV